VQPAYGEFYSHRISELSHESHPPIYSAPPLESPSGSSHAGATTAHAPSYAPEGLPQNYAPDSYSQGYAGQEYARQEYAGQEYTGQEYARQEYGYAPEDGYAPYQAQNAYPQQFEADPYHMAGVQSQGDPASHNVQAPQQNVEEEKPLIEF
jgi:UPF0755 protein